MKRQRGYRQITKTFGVLAAVLLLLVSCNPATPPPSAVATTPATAPKAGEASGIAGTAGLKRSSQGGNVTVDVTWLQGADSASSDVLSFAVAMNTHSVDMDGFDLAKLAALRTDDGKEVLPQRWDAPPGGHHRSGTLTFPSQVSGGPLIGPATRLIELTVRDVAGVQERKFQWEVSS